jgi:hypothetical protein
MKWPLALVAGIALGCKMIPAAASTASAGS